MGIIAAARASASGGLAVAVVLLAGCDTPARRGNAATFDVRGTLMENTCGPQAVPADRVLSFQAEIGTDRARATWFVRGIGTATGEWNASSRVFYFAHEAFITLREADRRNERAACVLRRLDVIEGVLTGSLPSVADAGAPDGGADASNSSDAAADGGVDAGDGGADAAEAPPKFEASETIVFGPVPGADCEDAIGVSDGQFSTLPCTQRYDMRGAARP